MSTPWRKIKTEIETVSPISVVACSGGVDSVFLLDLVSKCKVKFCVAYFDHGLGNGDTEFVRQLADQYNAKFFTDRGHNIDKASSIEAEARNQRYRFLRNVRNDFGAIRILTAHHQNDQVETILLRLFRGYNHSELGMRKSHEWVFRPLLEVNKSIILNQANKLGLKWLEDESNSNIEFERNWLRNEIIPQLMKRRNVSAIIKGLNK